MIKFYRGTKAKYSESPSTYTDGIYFTTDTNEILVNEEVYGKNADASVTTSDVVVAGGPLADAITNWPEDANWNVDGNRVIPAGTSMQSLTEKLFLQPEDGDVSWGSVSWDPTLGAPTVTLQKSDTTDAGSSAEVGTSLIVKTSLNSAVNGNTRTATCTTDYGYFDSLTGSYNAGNKTLSQAGNDPTGTLAATYKWNNTAITGFTSQSTTVTVVEGNNTFKVEQSGLNVTSSAFPTTTVYGSTNTKQIASSKTAVLNDTHKTSKDLTSSATDTITGYYRWNAFVADSIDITATASTWKFTNAKSVSQVTAADGKYIIVMVPSGFTLKTASQMNMDFKTSFTEKEVTLTIGGGSDTHTYTMHYWKNTTGSDASVDNITIS
jgi:hypothetical protein